MLNYIWIGLIVLGLLAAVGTDLADEFGNKFRNSVPLDAAMEIDRLPSGLRSTYEGVLVIPGTAFGAHYGVAPLPDPVRQPVTVTVTDGKAASLSMPITDATPAFWKDLAKSATSKERLMGSVELFRLAENQRYAAVRFTLEPIRFVKLKAVTQAALDYASMAVTIAIGLIGIMALWLGVMKVAEEAGMLKIVTRILAPVTRRIFPDVPSDHPAVSAMIMNIAANMLGLSNAATPMGLKAMEELNKLNPKLGTATNAMVTFLAINTGGLILIPATAIAVRAAAGSANPGIIIGTSIVGASCATIAGVVASKLLQRLPVYRKSMEVPRG